MGENILELAFDIPLWKWTWVWMYNYSISRNMANSAKIVMFLPKVVYFDRYKTISAETRKFRLNIRFWQNFGPVSVFGVSAKNLFRSNTKIQSHLSSRGPPTFVGRRKWCPICSNIKHSWDNFNHWVTTVISLQCFELEQIRYHVVHFVLTTSDIMMKWGKRRSREVKARCQRVTRLVWLSACLLAWIMNLRAFILLLPLPSSLNSMSSNCSDPGSAK